MSDNSTGGVSPAETSRAVRFEDVVETDTPFNTEDPARSLGRSAWMLQRLSAESLLVLTNPVLGLTPAQIVAVRFALLETIRDVSDFMEVGLEGSAVDKDSRRSNTHPLAAQLDDATEALDDVIQYRAATSDTGVDDPTITELGELSGQELIELLDRRTAHLTPAELPE